MSKNVKLENEQSEELRITPPEDVGAEQMQKTDEQEAIEAIKKFTDEDSDEFGEISVKSILGGDFLMSKFMMKQIMFVMFCVLLMILYTGNRYDSQQDTILIDSLRGRLQEVKYNVLTQSSELMNLMRQSNVEKMLSETPDSMLRNSITPPFLIKTGTGGDAKEKKKKLEEVLVDSAELLIDRQSPDEMEQSTAEEKKQEDEKKQQEGTTSAEEKKVNGEEEKAKEPAAEAEKAQAQKEDVKPEEKPKTNP